MSEFEFLDRVTIGQYVPGVSPLHRMDPRARLIAALLLLTAITFAPRPAGLGLALRIGVELPKTCPLTVGDSAAIRIASGPLTVMRTSAALPSRVVTPIASMAKRPLGTRAGSAV